MKNNEKGITLVALIITVIILVILAAVSIRTISNSKIVDVAARGAENYIKAGKQELKVFEDVEKALSGEGKEIVGSNGELQIPINLNNCSKYYNIDVKSEKYTGTIRLNVYSTDKTNYIGKVTIGSENTYSWKAADILSGSINNEEQGSATLHYTGTGTNGKITYDANELGSELTITKISEVNKEYTILGSLFLKKLKNETITTDDLISFVDYVIAQEELDDAYAYINTLEPEEIPTLNVPGYTAEKMTFDVNSEKALLNLIKTNKNALEPMKNAIVDQIILTSFGKYQDSLAVIFGNFTYSISNLTQNADMYTIVDYIEENDKTREFLTLNIGECIIPFTAIYLNASSTEISANDNFLACSTMSEDELKELTCGNISTKVALQEGIRSCTRELFI